MIEFASMLKKHIQSEIIKYLGKEPTKGQEELSLKFADFISESSLDTVFLLKGYA